MHLAGFTIEILSHLFVCLLRHLNCNGDTEWGRYPRSWVRSLEVLGSNFDMILNDGFRGYLQSFHANASTLPYNSSGQIYSRSFQLILHGQVDGIPVNPYVTNVIYIWSTYS